MEPLIPLIGMNPAELEAVAQDCGMPRYAARQMADWLYQKRVTAIDGMTNLSKRARAMLAQRYCTGREDPLKRVASADGTVKYLFRAAGIPRQSVGRTDHQPDTLGRRVGRADQRGIHGDGRADRQP